MRVADQKYKQSVINNKDKILRTFDARFLFELTEAWLRLLCSTASEYSYIHEDRFNPG